MELTHAIVDGDMFRYAAAFVGDKKSIHVSGPAGYEGVFKNRTAFWGHHGKKAGGELKIINSTRESPWMPEEFTIEDIVVPDPIENVLHTAKSMVDRIFRENGVKTYEFLMGKGESQRVALSTLEKYKGDRDNVPKPTHLESVGDYLAQRYHADIIVGHETDDECVIRGYRQPHKYVMGEDKDYWGCPIKFLDLNRTERGIVDCNKLGMLFLDAKKKVRGEGRMHFYWQVISQDDVDCYKANCFSDIEWGQMSAYNTLVGCKTDQECWQAMVDTFKYLYPVPKTVVGWRGEPIDIDWLYVMQEMVNMAHMKRTADEKPLNVKDILDKMGVTY